MTPKVPPFVVKDPQGNPVLEVHYHAEGQRKRFCLFGDHMHLMYDDELLPQLEKLIGFLKSPERKIMERKQIVREELEEKKKVERATFAPKTANPTPIQSSAASPTAPFAKFFSKR